ncbi:MAG: hypothetical protein QXS04_03175 [Thermoproteota archaeon]
MANATIWEWGDEFENVKTNSEKYVSKRWKETIKECGIDIVALERNEGISYCITAYTDNPEIVGKLAEGLFFVALGEGDTKVYFVSIRLSDTMLSINRKCHNTLEEVTKMLEERKKTLASKFMNHPKVKQAARGRRVEFTLQTNILCELESETANKIIVEVIGENFSIMRSLLDSLSSRIIKENLAKRILGYELGRTVKDYKVGDIDIWKDEVTVRLI